MTTSSVAMAQARNTGAVNISGLYMAANDSDLYYDFAGFSLKLGFYISETTELFGEVSFAEALDLPDYIDYSMNTAFMAGITQYIPLSDASSLYIRGKVGLTYNTWSYDLPYYSDSYYYYGYDYDEEDDTYFTYGIGAGFSVSLTEMIALEIGYDYIALDVSDQFDDGSAEHDDWSAYHTVHVGIDIEF
jgi:opacity protein-like surface antigen